MLISDNILENTSGEMGVLQKTDISHIWWVVCITHGPMKYMEQSIIGQEVQIIMIKKCTLDS